jgi:cyclopropane fatty-acyl-phospholipid synthase-like methyltransferase
MQRAKPIIIECMKRLNPNLVLDLGCGQCKFSKLFIDKGINVIGVDKEKTIEPKDNLTFVQKDIRDFEFNKKYDLIIGTGILHFLKREEANKLIEKMKDNTPLGGFHFLICMSNEERHNDNIHFYPNKEELNKLYSGWGIIQNELCLSKKHGEKLDQHKMIVFLAKKI